MCSQSVARLLRDANHLCSHGTTISTGKTVWQLGPAQMRTVIGWLQEHVDGGSGVAASRRPAGQPLPRSLRDLLVD